MTIPETELADRLLDVADRPETSMGDREVCVAAAEAFDAMRARLKEVDVSKAQVAAMHEALQDLHARMYGIALILKR